MTADASAPDEQESFRDLSPTDRRVLLRDAAINAELATGTQERSIERARRNVLIRLGTIVLGFAVLIGGLAMMILPGPGVLGVIIGLGLLARELVWAERLLEYVKKRSKIDELKQQPAWVRAAMWAGTIAAVGGSAYYFLVYR